MYIFFYFCICLFVEVVVFGAVHLKLFIDSSKMILKSLNRNSISGMMKHESNIEAGN